MNWTEKKMFNIETRRSHCKRQMIIVFDGVFGGILSYILDIYFRRISSTKSSLHLDNFEWMMLWEKSRG